MSDVEIRPARDEDLPAVAELRQRWTLESRGEVPAADEEFGARFAAWARAHAATHRCAVAVVAGRVVGMAWLAVVPRVPHPAASDRASGDVQSVYVLPDRRGEGLGGRLVDALLDQARALGLERVTVHSSERAVTAYERSGFAVSPHLLQVELGHR
ncbi:GNAT family N-acetyltransferase [Actinosynnema sp. NPDC023658]|uniref:GNAT family N-acetyltransferase n=1 Tax=Actinosynnema sp. NPDC023658 TaxID=3155465 RepID=UPI0033E0FF31